MLIKIINRCSPKIHFFGESSHKWAAASHLFTSVSIMRFQRVGLSACGQILLHYINFARMSKCPTCCFGVSFPAASAPFKHGRWGTQCTGFTCTSQFTIPRDLISYTWVSSSTPLWFLYKPCAFSMFSRSGVCSYTYCRASVVSCSLSGFWSCFSLYLDPAFDSPFYFLFAEWLTFFGGDFVVCCHSHLYLVLSKSWSHHQGRILNQV